jgi:Protein of unknown function (DUF2004)/Uncharacterized protein conserved in bacteria (DUF2262)
MANYSLPHFGNLDPKNLEEYYDVDIDFNGQKIQLDLNFENKYIDTKRLDIIKQFIENISEFDKKNKKYIEQDYADEDCDTVRTYIEHHIENFDKDELSEFIDFDNKVTSPEIQLMNSLRITRIGFYPDSEENFATFDYSINPETTDQLVVIFTYPTGEINYMTMES